MNKEYKIKLDLNKKLYNKKMMFNQFDENVNDFYIEITKNNEVVKDLDKSIITLVAIKPNGEVDAQFIEVKEGQIYADLKPSMCDLVGNYQAKAMIVLEGEIVTTDTINYSVSEDKIISRLNDDVVNDERFTLFTDALARLSTVEISEEQRMINEAERILSEENRKIEEAKRVEAELIRQHEEADRSKYDATRESNENAREANEATRQTNETKRVEAETQRQNRYNSFILYAEANANNFENYTNTAKVKEEERKSNESDRKSQEDRRVSNEVERISNENTRKANEVVREKNETSRQDVFENKVDEVDKKIIELNTTKDNFVSSVNTKVDTKISELDKSKSDMTNTVTNKIDEVETRFNALTSSQQQSSEVIDARDGETSLKARLDRDIEKAKQVYVNIEGSHISTDSSVGYLKDVEILGNTIQDASNLADIRSVGDKVEGQELYEIPVLCTNGLDSSDSNYKEHKLTILSPTPLEKVRDVADRIVCKDGVWGVEKNINTIVLNGSENWKKNVNSATHNRFTVDLIFRGNGKSNLICDQFPINGDTLTQNTVFIYNGGVLIIGVSNDIVENDVNKFKAWLQTNPTTVLYQLTEPTFIPLPHDQQIALRTFANKTNIHFLTEIEPTLKASVPKSIGATVNSHSEQIDNLSKELDSVKKLEESTASTVTTESDFTTVTETSNGYFEDVKLEGKTLVNVLSPKYHSVGTAWGTDEKTFILDIVSGSGQPIILGKFNQGLKRDTKYTAIVNVSSYTHGVPHFCFMNKENNKATTQELTLMSSGPHKLVFTTNADSDSYYFRILPRNGIDNKYSIDRNIIILEGDHTANPPSYFEGLKSVGQDVDEISVLSTNKEETKEDKKRILYYNDETQTWEKPILRQWDSIEKHSDGKYYYHKRCEEATFNGNENWSFSSNNNNSSNNNCTRFLLNEKTVKPTANSTSKNNLICTIFSEISHYDVMNTDIEGIGVHSSSNQINIKISNTKLSTQDTTSFKTWLQSNPVTVVYQLAEEKVYECTNLDLITYQNETNLLVKSGVLNPKVTLKVKKGIGNVVTMLQNKVAMLEDLVNKLIQK